MGEGGPLNNNNSGIDVYKIITLIIDMGGGGETKITYADTELAINIAIQKVTSALYCLSMRILRRLILKPRTDLYVFIFGGREFQTDGPENANLVS